MLSSDRASYVGGMEEDIHRSNNHHKTSISKKNEISTKRRCQYLICDTCHGQGKVRKPLSRKAQLRRKMTKEGLQEQTNSVATKAPSFRFEPCKDCENSSGLKFATWASSDTPRKTPAFQYNEELPHVAIVGGGIAGFALAVACYHRGIPHTVLERDAHFSQRRQGYGLTLQQASKALKHFGNTSTILAEGVTSTKHVVHKTDGTVVGEWGLRKWGHGSSHSQRSNKRQNIHISRQALRYQLLKAMDESRVEWNSRLVKYHEMEDGSVKLDIQIQNDNQKVTTRTISAGLVVGADGIRSQVRQQLIGEETTPLRYLDCLVVLGICPLSNLENIADSNGLTAKEGGKDFIQSNSLLDGATVFQTADGNTRIYMMPYSKTDYMWQLSFPLSEEEASCISALGSQALKNEALKRCGSWHSPIPEVLKSTPLSLVSGYPVFDRALLNAKQLRVSPCVTLIGDACHPMSPFKGQGANQAMLDALSLANSIYYHCGGIENKKKSTQQELSHRQSLHHALHFFEDEMLSRSSVKVQASADAAKFLHSEVAIQEGNVTRGAVATKKNTEALLNAKRME